MPGLTDQDLLRERCYVGGERLDADDGKVLTVTDPPSCERIGQVPAMGAAEMRRAIDAAKRTW
jgi:succinate-semialdehyde dehydrogenase/glutarate-semialdehyde dehydrogenase